MPDTRWPNLFIVGAGKAGTYALWRYLDEHPDIFMSLTKEPRFFAHLPWNDSWVEDERTYRRLFTRARDHAFAGEASPTYLHPEHVPAAIREVVPDARILISLREPVDHTRSLYLHTCKRGVERRALGQAVREELRDGAVYPDREPYLRPRTPAVARYLDTFDDRVLVLFFEDLVADPRGTVRRIFEFLDLDPAPADLFEAKPYNTFALARNRAAERLLGSERAVRVARRIVPRPLRDPIFRVMMPPISKPELEPEVVDLLREFYEPDVADLRALLEHRLPEAWERRFPAAARGPGRALG